MAIIGFGSSCFEKTRNFLDDLAEKMEELESGQFEAFVRDAIKKLGQFQGLNGKLFDFGFVRFVSELQRYKGANVVIIEGECSHYRLDHPLSADGFAAWHIPFCITVLRDTTWGTRVHVAL